MTCTKATNFGHGDQVLVDGVENEVGTVLGKGCKGEVFVKLNNGIKGLDPSNLVRIGHRVTEQSEIHCLTCYTIREWAFYFARFWFPPIAMGLAFGYTGLTLFGG